jgi:hypothetical protein
MTLLDLVITALVAGVGAYFGSYLKKKGENLATHEDLDKLIDQVSRVTEVTKKIEARVSDEAGRRASKAELQLKAIDTINTLTSQLVTNFTDDDKHVPSNEWFSSFSAASSMVKALFDEERYAKFKSLEILVGPGLSSEEIGATFAVWKFVEAKNAAVKAMYDQVIGNAT